MSARLLLTVYLLAFGISKASLAAAGSIFVLGDSTPAFDLTEAPPHVKVDQNNRELFARFLLISSGEKVVYILSNSLIMEAIQEIGDFYTEAGAIVRVERPIESTSLIGVQLLVVLAPKTKLQDQEVAAIHRHVSSGGDLLVLGEPARALVGKENINLLLEGLGSGLRLDDNVVKRTGRVTRVSSDPLVDGISWITIGGANGVSGGDPLISDDETNVPLLAREDYQASE